MNESDPKWIADAIDHARIHPNDPYAGVGLALVKLKERGATDQEITGLVRGMQAELLFSFCYLLDDPGELEPEVSNVSWALTELDEDGNIVGAIGGLHESVLETDPTGREMRPQSRDG